MTDPKHVEVPDHEETEHKRKRGVGDVLRKLIPILLVLAGVVVLLYPVVATNFNNIKQHEFSQSYNKEVQQAAPSVLDSELVAARVYNKTLDGVPILDPWLTVDSNDPKSGPYRNYLSRLAALGDVMARVRVPSANIDLPVRHGTTDRVIGEGAGHLYGTSLPVGGDSTHSVITSHTGMANATLFDHLTDVKEGDMMYVDVYGETLAYQVDSIKIIQPNQLDDLKQVKGQDLLSLFTCYPYAVNTHRLVVTGHRVPYNPETMAPPAADPTSAIKLEPWMYGLIAGAAVGLALLIYIAVHEARKRKRLAALAEDDDDDEDKPAVETITEGIARDIVEGQDGPPGIL